MLEFWEDIDFTMGGVNAQVLRTASICRVPEKIREANKEKSEEWYSPKFVAVGPIHRGATTGLQTMELTKWRYADKFTSRLTRKIELIQESSAMIRRQKGIIRGSYGDTMPMETTEFAGIMLLDACFLFELLLRLCENDTIPPDLGYMDDYKKMSRLLTDLMLLENQVPFLLLTILSKNFFELAHEQELTSLIALSRDRKLSPKKLAESLFGVGCWDVGRGSLDVGNGSLNVGRGSPESPNVGRGSPDVGRGSPDFGPGSPDVELGSPDVGRGSPDFGRGSPDVALGSPDVGRGSLGNGSPDFGGGSQNVGNRSPDFGRRSSDIELGSPEVGRGSPDVGLGSPEVGRGSPDVELGSPDIGRGSRYVGSRSSDVGSQSSVPRCDVAFFDLPNPNEVYHFLHLVYLCSPDPYQHQVILSEHPLQLHRCARKLQAFGIRIVARPTIDNGGNINRPPGTVASALREFMDKFEFEIEFNEMQRELIIPTLHIKETTEVKWRNFIAWEQIGWLFRVGYKFTSYAYFFKGLVCSVHDVQLLRESGVIEVHTEANNEDLLIMFKSIATGAEQMDWRYNRLCEKLNKANVKGVAGWCELIWRMAWHYWRRFLEWLQLGLISMLRSFVLIYLGTPWKFIGVVSGTALLVLTFMQTIYAARSSH